MGKDPESDDENAEFETNRQRGEHTDFDPGPAGWVEGDERARKKVVNHEADRTNATLTKSQRRFLLNDYQPNHPTVYRDRFRTRVQHALMDGNLLAVMDARDRELIFQPEADHPNMEANMELGARGWIKFLYMGLGSDQFFRTVSTAINELREDMVSLEIVEKQTVYPNPDEWLSPGPLQSLRADDNPDDDETPDDSKEGDEHAG